LDAKPVEFRSAPSVASPTALPTSSPYPDSPPVQQLSTEGDAIASSGLLDQSETLEQNLKLSADCSERYPDECQPASLTLKAEFQIFLSTFITIFLAEIGDKTQLTVLLMSAESHSPWLVFLGAGTALIATSLCGVLLGRWLSTRLSPRVLEVSAAVLLLLISGLLVWDVFLGG
jgi:putative Ca2+/H+ antiporter (TMEM165/GDT1 family)